MKMYIASQKGDTIIEVLITIAIISTVLVGAFIATNKNIATIQNTQEHSQAQKLVESQIESLRNAGKLTSSGDCFDNSGAETTPANCNVSGIAGSGATYVLKLTGPAGNIYTISAIWTSLGAQTNNDSNVTMYYRLK